MSKYGFNAGQWGDPFGETTKYGLHAVHWGDQYGETSVNEPEEDISHISIVIKGDTIQSFSLKSSDDLKSSDGLKISDDSRNSSVLSLFGRKKGVKRAKIDIIIQNEKIRVISGTFDMYESRKMITSLSFTTDNNNKLYGPFGSKKGTAFSMVVKDHSFSRLGAHCGWLLDDTGVKLGYHPFTITDSVRPFGGEGGENQYDYKAKGEISRICIKYEGGIRSIRFTSKDEKGRLKTSRRIGGAPEDQCKTAEIVVDAKNGEKIVGISGTVGIYLDFLVITSLKFYTSANRSFGPFGGGAGDPFSYMAEEGYITGFYGRDGGLLDSIGLHIQVMPNLDLLVESGEMKQEPQCESNMALKS